MNKTQQGITTLSLALLAITGVGFSGHMIKENKEIKLTLEQTAQELQYEVAASNILAGEVEALESKLEEKEEILTDTHKNLESLRIESGRVEAENKKLESQIKQLEERRRQIEQTKITSFGPNSDVTVIRVTNGNILNKGLKGELKGHGWDFVNAGKKYGIDPLFLAAIAAQESGWGKFDHNNNNIFGIASGKKSFSSVSACIDYTAKLLSEKYVKQGLNTPTKIGRKYCPDAPWAIPVSSCANLILKGI